MSLIIHAIRNLTNCIDHLNEWIGKTIAWLTLGMVLVTFVIVILRYFFDLGWIALQESVNYMHAMVFMLGAAYTLKQDKHVRVDILYQGLAPRNQAWIDCAGILFLLFPVCGFMIWSSLSYVEDAWQIHEGSRNSGGLPGLYLLKTTLWIMPGLLILQGLALLLQKLTQALGLRTD